MGLDLDAAKIKIALLADPNSGYTQKEFLQDFGGTSTTPTSESDIFKLKFHFSNKSTNEDPSYATDGSSGFDLRADVELPIVIKPSKTAVIPTGLFFNIPSNFEIQIRSRSGLAAKNQVIVLNAPGTIDADYRGEIKIILINHGETDFIVNKGDRVAQAIIAFVHAKNIVNLIKVDDVSVDTNRGDGGFGSTGLR